MDYLKIATDYANSLGYDAIRYAGEENFQQYFHYYRNEDVGKKLGLPHILRITKQGKINEVVNTSEINRATRREITLNKLEHRD